MARLLIVDDEAPLLALLGRYLERHGYDVTLCATPAAAVELFSLAPAKFDMLITDLSLPGMNGEELIAELRRKNPKLPALIASGYPYEPQTQGVLFLQKPFLPQMLVELVEKALKR
ncbi:MAG: response regulator [Acidobacteriota bacterium]